LLLTKRLRYPTGVRPLLIEETARRRRIESRFVDTLETSGFAEVVLPIIDYVDPYAPLVDRDAARQSYRFTDREGDLVAIRSDFTPMLARALAPAITDDDLPLRVFYRGDVIRCEASRLGANRELFQIGAEVVGDDSVACDVEVMRLAAELLQSFGVRPLVVYNDVRIAPRGTSAVLDAHIADETTHDDLPPSEATARLRAVSEQLDASTFSLHLDDVDPNAGYYTGIRFRVYAADTRRLIAQGGRYDALYGRFGTPAAAIGFTFTIDDLD